MSRKNDSQSVIRVIPDIFLRVFFSRYFLLAIIMITSALSMAQDDRQRRGSRVIDDTTKQVYGPNTSRYYFEQDVFYNRQVLYPIDTLIRNFHRFNYVQRNNNLYQDLGNIGSAIQPIFYQAPDVIGARSGAHVYDLYWDSEPVRYYDTKSPYSNMRVILGGKGRSITRATFSRNINPRWNFGFTYRGLFIDKQIQKSGKGDRFGRDNYYDAFTAFQNKDSTYRLFFNFRRSFHRAEEFGGVKFNTDTFALKDFFEINAQPWLTAAESNDLRMNVHMFHQYKIGRALQLYHTFDRYRQKNIFLDFQNGSDEDFFDFVEIETDSVLDWTKFKTVRNEAGIKGNLSKLFYNGYYAIRHFSMTYNNLQENMSGNESYLGGRISLALDSIGEVNGNIEVMQQGSSSNGYLVQGEIKSRWFEARVKQMQYAPGFFEQRYRGAHDVWTNDFPNTETTQLNGYLHYRSSVLNLSPGLTFTRLRNYIYYERVSEIDTVQQVLPVQSSGNQVMALPEVRASLTFFRHITLSGQVIYTKLLQNADNALSVPELFVNSQLSYSNIFFNGNLDMHAGVDVHWKSDYYAAGYDVAIRQFYRQDTFNIPAYSVVDIFFNAKIKRGRVFFKYHNLLQAFTKSGYLPTPYYPGQSNSFDFGFDWSFYD